MNTPPADITLFGATGFTGQRIAQILDREGIPFRLAGRSEEKLALLSANLASHPGWLIADATRPASLPALFQDTRLLINCAGPFTDLGERVIALAAMSGIHYVDTTNELSYVFRARGYHSMAKKNGAVLVPSCAFEVALADCATHLAAAPLLEDPSAGLLDQIDVVYALDGQKSSRGTRLSAIRSLATSWIAYRDGEWKGQIPGGRVRQFKLPGALRSAYTIPSCESITVPAHLPVRRMDTWMAASPLARFWAPLAIPLLARLSRSVLRELVLNAAGSGGARSSVGKSASESSMPFTVYTQVRRGSAVHAIALTGKDPYQLTAEIVGYAARAILDPGFQSGNAPAGLLAPAQLFEPASFLGYAQNNWGVTLQTGPF